jgi:hypothetical protein
MLHARTAMINGELGGNASRFSRVVKHRAGRVNLPSENSGIALNRTIDDGKHRRRNRHAVSVECEQF